MGINDYPHAGTNRKAARRQRAAERLQITSKPFFTRWDSHALQRLETKLQEFLGMCRNGTISQSNVYAAACNILQPVHAYMPLKDYHYWFDRFNREGTEVFTKPVFRA